MSTIDPREVLRRYGLRPRKGLGQNFLVDRSALERIVAAAELTSQDTLVEVGPGVGQLTQLLADAAGRVVAVELDAQMVQVLRQELAGRSNVEVVEGDILEVDVGALAGGRPYKVVANLPYYITSAALRHLLEAQPPPTLLVVTVQQEVAERITAQPGAMSLLAVSVQFYGRPRRVARIPAGPSTRPPRSIPPPCASTSTPQPSARCRTSAPSAFSGSRAPALASAASSCATRSPPGCTSRASRSRPPWRAPASRRSAAPRR